MWVRIAFHFLIFSAVAGLLLRVSHVITIPINYKNILHTHSHIAILGWMYLAFAAALVREFFPHEHIHFRKIFVATLVTIIGMIVSFPFEGYGVFSISFSTLFLFASYWFVYVFSKKLKSKGSSIANGFAFWSLFYLVLSSLGPWVLGPIKILIGSHSIEYNLAIYYYLHFMYNGFLVLASFAIIIKKLENEGIAYSIKRAKWFFKLTVYAVLPLYALFTLWINPPAWVYIMAVIAAFSQVVALMFGWSTLMRFKKSISRNFYRNILVLVLIAYLTKVVMQLFASFPAMAEYAYNTRVFTAIGYIHLVMLGFLTLILLIYFVDSKLFYNSNFVKLGFVMLIMGIALSESILFTNGLLISYKGISISNYSQWLVMASSLMPIGLIMIWIKQFKKDY